MELSVDHWKFRLDQRGSTWTTLRITAFDAFISSLSRSVELAPKLSESYLAFSVHGPFKKTSDGPICYADTFLHNLWYSKSYNFQECFIKDLWNSRWTTRKSRWTTVVHVGNHWFKSF